MKSMLTTAFCVLLAISPGTASAPASQKNIQQPTAYVCREMNGHPLKLYVFMAEAKKNRQAGGSHAPVSWGRLGCGEC